MSDRKAEAALERNSSLREEKQLWLPHWQELADHVQPRKSNVSFQRSPGAQQTEVMFDSTAPHANTLLAASMQGALTSAAVPWFQYRVKGVHISKDHELNKALAICTKDSIDAINESNFASETHEVYLDAPCFGVAALLVEEKSYAMEPGALRFTALPPGSFAIDENEDGYVDTVAREFKMSARAAAQAFGRDKIGKQVEAALKQNPNQKFEFLHLVWPRGDAGMGKARLPAVKKPYGSLWVDIAGRVTVRESGYDEPCLMVPRWSKASGETYGRGPASTALADIKTLNKAVELKLKAWAKIVDPPVKVRDEGVVGGGANVKLHNGGITYVRDMDAIQLLDLGGRMDVADMEEEKLRQAIRRMFFSDQLQLQEGPQMTAYEVQVRYELMQRILGPTLGRLTVELLNPLIERIWWIRLRASARNSAYRQVEAWCKQNGVRMDIEYEGPLAQAQRLQESISLQRFWQIVLPLAQIDPKVLDVVDLDEMVRIHGVSVGIPASVMRPQEATDTIRTSRLEAQEKEAAMAKAESAAKTGKDMVPLIEAMNASGAGTGVIPSGAGSGVLTSG